MAGVVGGGPGDERGASEVGSTHGEAVAEAEAVDLAAESSADADLALSLSFSLCFSFARAPGFLSARRTMDALRTGSSDSVAGVEGLASFSFTSFSFSFAAFDLGLDLDLDLAFTAASLSRSSSDSSSLSLSFAFSFPLPVFAFATLAGFAGARSDSGGWGESVGRRRFFDSGFEVDANGVDGIGDFGRADVGVFNGKGTTGESRDNLEKGTEGDAVPSVAIRCFEEVVEEVEDVEDVAEIGRGRSDVERSGGVRDGGTGGGGMSRESTAWWRQTRVSEYAPLCRGRPRTEARFVPDTVHPTPSTIIRSLIAPLHPQPLQALRNPRLAQPRRQALLLRRRSIHVHRLGV